MLPKITYILLLTGTLTILTLADLQTRQTNNRLLPEELTETEMQTILKEQRPKGHVEVALKISDARVNNAYKLSQNHDYQGAAQDIDVYAALIRYTDNYTRRLPGSEIKDRNNCLKKIEQAIFKQSRTLEAVVRELPLDIRETTERTITEVKKIRLRAINDLIGNGNTINSSSER